MAPVGAGVQHAPPHRRPRSGTRTQNCGDSARGRLRTPLLGQESVGWPERRPPQAPVARGGIRDTGILAGGGGGFWHPTPAA